MPAQPAHISKRSAASRGRFGRSYEIVLVSFLGSLLVHLAAAPAVDLTGADIEGVRPVIRGADVAPAQLEVMIVKAAPKPEPKPQAPIVVPDEPEPEPEPEPKVVEASKPEPKPKVQKRPRRVRKANKRRVAKTPPPPEAAPDGHAQRLGVKTDNPEEAEGLAGDPSEAGSGAVADNAPAAPAGGDPSGHEDGVDAPAPVDLDKLLRSYIAKVARSVRRDMTYPRAALRAELEGRCVVAVTIDGGGRVVSIAIARSSGHSVLDKAAVAAVSRVERVPPPPTALAWSSREVQVPFTFRLRG